MSSNLKRGENIPAEIAINDVVTFNNSAQEYKLERIEKTPEGRERFHWLSKCSVCGGDFTSTTVRMLGGITRTCAEHRDIHKKRNTNLTMAPGKKVIETATDYNGLCYMEYAINNGLAALYDENIYPGKTWDEVLGTRDGSLMTRELWEKYTTAAKRFERKYGITNAWSNALADWARKNNLIHMMYGAPCELDTAASGKVAKRMLDELASVSFVDDVI